MDKNTTYNRIARHSRSLGLVTLLFTLGVAGPAGAEPTPDEVEREATIIHHPPAELTEGGPVELQANIQVDWKLEDAWVAVRPLGSEEKFEHLELKRTSEDQFATSVPETLARPPGIEYFIASTDKSGADRHHFASPDQPHAVLINKTDERLKEEEYLARYAGDRSKFELRGQYTAYGRRQVDSGEVPEAVSEDTVTDRMSDTYWFAELEYTYRIMTWIHDIRFGVGRLRGQTSTVNVDGQTYPVRSDADEDDPGMDYGFGEATLSFHENFSWGLGLVLGASEEGFSAGVGSTVYIGPITGTHLELGGELQQELGNRGYMAFAWDTVPRVPMALTIELTSRPDFDNNPNGTRLIYDIGYDFSDALKVNGQIGYASRSSGIEGGIVGGVSTSYEF